MFSFIKNKEVKLTEEKMSEESLEHRYPQIVQEIHNEFNTAADKLLKEANITLETTRIDNENKIKLLNKFGFRQVSEVKEAEKKSDLINISKEQSELINKYKLNYPLNKFITEKQVKAICRKYNLICGEVSKYKGFVPEKNLLEISNFKGIKEEDITYYEHSGKGKKEISKDEYDSYYSSYSMFVNYVKGDVLSICAPVKDMDTRGMKIVDGYKLQNIPDPVVLHPIKGGYLILTAWGDEASDPNVVNEILN